MIIYQGIGRYGTRETGRERYETIHHTIVNYKFRMFREKQSQVGIRFIDLEIHTLDTRGRQGLS